MGVMKRFFRMCGADLHGVMDELEDKGLLLKRCIRRMEEELIRKQGDLRMRAERKRRLESELGSLEEHLAAASSDADAAVARGKDDIARLLLKKRRSIQSSKTRLEREIAELAHGVESMGKTVERQRRRLLRLKEESGIFLRAGREQRGFEGVRSGCNPPFPDRPESVRDEEIELELIRRKERLEREESREEERHENL